MSDRDQPSEQLSGSESSNAFELPPVVGCPMYPRRLDTKHGDGDQQVERTG